jgi:NAD+ diphosphatase
VTAGGPPLSRAQYDRAALHRSDDAWLADAWQRAKVVVVSPRSATPVSGGRVVLRDAGDAPDGPRRFLGLVDDVPYFAVTAEPAADESDAWQTLREFGGRAHELDADLVASAIALEQWHQRHQFCPRCGAPTLEAQAGWTRVCTAEGSQHFPRTDPAVIMLIHDGADRALLGRGPQWGPGRFSTLAGFVEPGESLESAVAREVFEEVGVRIRDIRYLGSQPWPFPASLMVGFVARLDGAPSLTLDPVEMAEAGWFTRDEIAQAADWTDDEFEADPAHPLRAIPPHFSISRYLIDSWLAGDV